MGMKQSFGAANMLADLLRCNLDVQFWRRTVKLARRYVQANISEFGEHPCALVWQNRPTRLVRTNIDSYMMRKQYQTSFEDEEVPKITCMDYLGAWSAKGTTSAAVRYKSHGAQQLFRKIHQLPRHFQISSNTCLSSLPYFLQEPIVTTK